MLIAQTTKRIEHGSGEQPASMLQRNHLTPVEMARKNQIIAPVTRASPYARVMRAQYSIIAVGHRCSFGTGDSDFSRTVGHACDAAMNPCSAAAHYRIADSVHTDALVMIAANRVDRRQLAKSGDQVAQAVYFRRMVNEVAAQQHHVCSRCGDGLDYLPAEVVGTCAAQMYVAHVQQTARVMPQRQALLADRKRSVKPDRKWSCFPSH
jgi:hypothetical protein